MRHVDPYHHKINLYGRNSFFGNIPYENNYSFTKPTPNSLYVKILTFVYEHPGCSRAEILVGIRKYKNIKEAKTLGRGQYSSLFSQMLYKDILDYEKNGVHNEYYITDKGREILFKKVIPMEMEMKSDAEEADTIEFNVKDVNTDSDDEEVYLDFGNATNVHPQHHECKCAKNAHCKCSHSMTVKKLLDKLAVFISKHPEFWDEEV